MGSEKRDNYAKLIRENNERKAQEKRMVQERRKAALAEQERVRSESEAEKQRAIKDAERQAELAKNSSDPSDDLNASDDKVLVEAIEAPIEPDLTQRGENLTELVVGEEGLQDEGEHEHGETQHQRLELGEVLYDGGVQKTENIDSSLEKVFGPGATRLALEFQGDKDEVLSSSSDASDLEDNISESTPAKDQRKKRARRSVKFGDLSGISEVITLEYKKPRLGVDEETFEESLGAIAALINQHEAVPLEDPGPVCSRDVGPDLAGPAGGIVTHREVPPGDPEPPDGVGAGVLELPGVGDQREDVPLGVNESHDDVSQRDQDHCGDYDGQGSPRPSQ